MAEIKVYSCKRCKIRGKEFKSNRGSVRKHLRDVHGVRGTTTLSKKRKASNVTLNTLSEVMK